MIIYTANQGNSLTFGILFPESYLMANARNINVQIGGKRFEHTVIDKMVRVELQSADTIGMQGAKELVLSLDDVATGVRKVNLGQIKFADNTSTFSNQSTNTGYNFTVILSLDETAITLGDILYDYVKGADGEKGEPGENAVLPPNIVIDPDYTHTDNNFTDLDKLEVAKVAGKENTGVAQSLVTQLIDGATDNTLKKLQDKITAINAIIGGSAPDGDNIVNTVAELLAVFSTFPEGSDMVTLLTAKLNITDVYNALDQLLAGKALDARQGKVLKDLCDGLRTDLTNHNHSGTYEPANSNIQAHISATGNPHGANISDIGNVDLTETTPLDTDSILIQQATTGMVKKSLFTTLKTWIEAKALSFSQLITFASGAKLTKIIPQSDTTGVVIRNAADSADVVKVDTAYGYVNIPLRNLFIGIITDRYLLIQASGGQSEICNFKVQSNLGEFNFINNNGGTAKYLLKILSNGSLSIISGQYTYNAASPTADTVNDRRTSNVAGVEIKEICTVAKATKGGGTWVPVETSALISLTDSNELIGAGSFIDLTAGKSGRGSIIFGDGVGYADFIFTSAGVVTLIQYTSNVFTSVQTGTNHVIIKDNGTNVRIVNEMGSTMNFNVKIQYN